MAVARAGAGLDVRKHLNKRVVALYRRMCREVTPIRTQYIIDETPAEIRHMVLLQFRKYDDVTDPRVIDALLQKGEMELKEARQQWKQRGHLMAMLKPDVPPPEPALDAEEFFRRFLDGTFDMERDIFMGGDDAKIARMRTVMAANAAARAGLGSGAGAEPFAAKFGGVAPGKLE